MPARWYIAVFVASGVLLGILAVSWYARDVPYNVVLISIDTFGAKHAGLYQKHLDTTPFLNELAQSRAVVFENAVSQAPWTLPSHTAMLTGDYPVDHNTLEYGDALPESAYTLAEGLHEKGYTTVGFSTGAFIDSRWQFDQGFDEFFESARPNTWNNMPEMITRSVAWIDQYSNPKPFFLFFRTFHPHHPYMPEGIVRTKIVDTPEIVTANQKGYTSEDVEHFRSLYRDEVREVDAQLRNFFTELESRGLLRNTIVVITSDHGEEFGEHGILGFHALHLYHESLWVPLMVVHPDMQASRIESTVEVRSIPHTLFALLNFENPFVGPSLFDGEVVALSDTVIDATVFDRLGSASALAGVTKEAEESFTGKRARSAFRYPWHAIVTLEGEVELYNIERDRNEAQNLAGSVEETDEIAPLADALKLTAEQRAELFK